MFYRLVVILIQSWEGASTALTWLKLWISDSISISKVEIELLMCKLSLLSNWLNIANFFFKVVDSIYMPQKIFLFPTASLTPRRLDFTSLSGLQRKLIVLIYVWVLMRLNKFFILFSTIWVTFSTSYILLFFVSFFLLCCLTVFVLILRVLKISWIFILYALKMFLLTLWLIFLFCLLYCW